MNLFDLLRAGFTAIPHTGHKGEGVMKVCSASALPATGARLTAVAGVAPDAEISIEVTSELWVRFRVGDSYAEGPLERYSPEVLMLIKDVAELQRLRDRERRHSASSAAPEPENPPMRRTAKAVHRVVEAATTKSPSIHRQSSVDGVWSGL